MITLIAAVLCGTVIAGCLLSAVRMLCKPSSPGKAHHEP